jgi:hypothetical protein
VITPMKQNTIKVSTPELANYKARSHRLTASRIDLRKPLPTGRSLGRLAYLCLVSTMALVPGRYARADADDSPARILSFQNDSVASTVPGNGDVNPYGVAFVPRGFPGGGLLKPGDILVSNFNDKANVQGTGTTIVDVAPNNQVSLFFQGTPPLGLSTGLAVLKAGFVLVANCPTNGATPLPMALPGSLLLIDRFGKLSDTLALPGFIEGPWDFTVQDKGFFVKVFISNVLTGTVSRLDLSIAGGKFLVLRKALVASGYMFRPDAVTFEVGPTGLVYDAQHEVLYVASTGDNEVFAVADAGDRTTPLPDGQSKGTVIYADNVHLHGALAMAQAPNGHLLVSNSDGINADPNQPSEIVEFTVKGQFIGELSVDAMPGGAFGLSLVKLNDDQVRFAAVDDVANVLKLMTVNVPDSPPAP